ncbi:MAG: T9SS type A sorting domain-containing protein [Candidatus Eisenbacteria bacterium]|nr:T9SS type A sorting domain-containing protein [Candidatus Latescibacterota bacterium]MBD3303111.1 T9SS type A sorting domain-containing protein [Candidatus Eisenbacteria bacterium]
MRIDGLYEEIGATDCETMANRYRSWVEKRLALTEGESPVAIEGEWIPAPDALRIRATFRLVEEAGLSDLVAVLLLFENDVSQYVGPGSPEVWQNVTRAIHEEAITLSGEGDEVALETILPVDGDWVLDNVQAVAFLQQTSGEKPIVQGAALPANPDFAFDPPKVRSVPGGEGVALFRAQLSNLRPEEDLLTLSVDSPFGDWPAEIVVEGLADPHAEPVSIPIGPGESRAVTVRVTTDETREIRSGTFAVRSSLSDRTQTVPMRVFNGSRSILLVDDDAGQTDEEAFVTIFEETDRLYEHWDVRLGMEDVAPTFREMFGFDLVVWATGWSDWPLISWDDQRAMDQYLASGGGLFLASQEYLDRLWWTPNFFTEEVLDLEGWEIDLGYEELVGIAGDPIGHGLSLPLELPDPGYAEGDGLGAGPAAIPFLRFPGGETAAIRRALPDGGRVVFLATCFNGIRADDPDPNNRRVVLDRVLAWLLEGQPSGLAVGQPQADPLVGTAFPNPSSGETRVGFDVPARAAGRPVRAVVFDATGRRVRALRDTPAEAGSHTILWDGRDGAGRDMAPGVYLLRVEIAGGVETRKLLRLD